MTNNTYRNTIIIQYWQLEFNELKLQAYSNRGFAVDVPKSREYGNPPF